MYEKQMSFFEDGGLKEEGGMIDEVSGNDVPVGSTRKEVRDDIPAMLSEGEFVFPADVVRYIGLDRLMQIRQEAKMGLKKMEAMGQMGNSDEATIPDDLPFGLTDLVIIDAEEPRMDNELARGGMPMKFQEGGTTGSYKDVLQGVDTSFAKPAGGFTAVPTGQGFTLPAYTSGAKAAAPAQAGSITIKTFKNAQGIELPIPFSGNQPLYPIPYGFTETTAQTNAVQAAQTQPSKTTAEQRMSEAGPIDQAEMSTVPTPDEIAQMSAEELADLAKSAQNMSVLGPALGIANPVLGIMGRVISKDYMSRVKDPIAKRAEELNIPNPLDKEEDKNIIDKIKSIFTKTEEETKKDDKKEDKTKEAIPTVISQEPTKDTTTSKTNIDDENVESTFNFNDDDLAMAQAVLGNTQTAEDFKADMEALATAQNLSAEDVAMAQDVLGKSTSPSMDEAITGIDVNEPGQLTGGKDVSQDVVNAVATQAAISRAANVESKIGLDVFGPTATSTTPTGLSEEGRGYANPPSTSANLTGIQGLGTDFSQPDADTGKDTSPSVSISAASPSISGAMSAARSGFGTSPQGEFGGTPTVPGDEYGGYGNLAGDYSGAPDGPSGNFGGGDNSVSGAESAASMGFGSDPGGEFGGVSSGSSDNGNASPDPGVAGAEVGTGPNGEDAEGPFNKGGFVKKKSKPKKAATTKPRRGLAARK